MQFHFHLEWCDLFLKNWFSGLLSHVCLNLAEAVYFQRSSPGTVITMASFSLCRIVSFSFFFPPLVLSYERLSDVAVFTRTDKSSVLAPDRAWKQSLKLDKGEVGWGSSGDEIWNYPHILLRLLSKETKK